MTVTITGVQGWIGSRVAALAGSRGVQVLGVDVQDYGRVKGISFVPGDISSDTVLALSEDQVLRRSSAIVHCAGYAHRPRETAEEIARFHAVNRLGTLRVLELARRAGIPRVVYISSIAFYDWSQRLPVREDGLLSAPTAYARSKLAGEEACLASGLDARVVRLATVFGEGDRANFSKLASALHRRRFVVPGAGSARKSVIPVDLVAELLVDLAVRGAVPHRVVNLALPDAPTLGEICDAYTAVCGFPAARRVPVAVMKGLAAVGSAIDRVRPEFRLTLSTLRKLTTSTYVDVSRMRETWPDRKWPTFRHALADCAEYYRSLT